MLKGFNGVWETLTGIVFLSVGKEAMSGFFMRLMSHELLEDPHDSVIQFFTQTISNTSHATEVFAAVYILFHGLLNLFLVFQLQKQRHWAYGFTIGATILFMVYQVHRIFLYHSTFLIALTIFDCVYIYLAWSEYKRVSVTQI